MPAADIPEWQQILDAEDAAVAELAHKALSARARKLMPLLDDATARAMRWAILAGPGNGLSELVGEHNHLLPYVRL